MEKNKLQDHKLNVKSAIPKKRQDLLKWNGWGYQDSGFVAKEGVIHFIGKRYPVGETELPYLTEWAKDTFNLDLNKKNLPQSLPSHNRYPQPKIVDQTLELIQNLGVEYSLEGIDRLIRAHGHTMHDVFTLRESFFDRIPDIVMWPKCHEDVERIVAFADENDVVIIPFGGGTSVSGAVTCPGNENRAIISLDTSQMNRILWVDRDNLVACCEAGIIGQDLERELKNLGFTTGHEPDSYEFSSLGGWIATRASGMKKNIYGNIEDLAVHVKMATPKGTLQKNCQVPRMSCGPDFNNIILGSEGTLGVVTEVILKIRPLPQCKKYGSVVFPNFESGVQFMREVARQRCQPASIRLMDNQQFIFGQALRPKPGYLGSLGTLFKKFYVTRIKGFDLTQMCVVTLLFEGDKNDVNLNEKKIYSIAKEFGGMPAGEINGERGYMLTFVIAYIRDIGLDHYVVAESFETSVPWDRALSLCKNVKHRVAKECQSYNIKHFMITCRVTQTYDSGCCIYFYFGFNYEGLKDPVHVYESIEEKARDEIIAAGGSISHHHGVGKLRKKWYKDTVSELGVSLFNATKLNLDPKNIFASGNIIKAKL